MTLFLTVVHVMGVSFCSDVRVACGHYYPVVVVVDWREEKENKSCSPRLEAVSHGETAPEAAGRQTCVFDRESCDMIVSKGGGFPRRFVVLYICVPRETPVEKIHCHLSTV